MTSQNQQVLVLRDNDGNFYLLSQDMIANARVPAEKQAELQKAIGGDDVGGFFFNTNIGNTSNLAFIGQANNQSANNVVFGGFALVGSQTALNLGSNSANVNQGGART